MYSYTVGNLWILRAFLDQYILEDLTEVFRELDTNGIYKRQDSNESKPGMPVETWLPLTRKRVAKASR